MHKILNCEFHCKLALSNPVAKVYFIETGFAIQFDNHFAIR